MGFWVVWKNTIFMFFWSSVIISHIPLASHIKQHNQLSPQADVCSPHLATCYLMFSLKVYWSSFTFISHSTSLLNQLYSHLASNLVQTQSGSLLLCHTFISACISSDFPFLCFSGIQLCLIELPLTSSSDREETWPIIFVLSALILSYSFITTLMSNSLPVSGQGWTKLGLNGNKYANGWVDQTLESLAEHQPHRAGSCSSTQKTLHWRASS